MKALPWILLALLIVAGVVAWLIIRNPLQRASVTVGTPDLNPWDASFVDSLPFGYV